MMKRKCEHPPIPEKSPFFEFNSDDDDDDPIWFFVWPKVGDSQPSSGIRKSIMSKAERSVVSAVAAAEWEKKADRILKSDSGKTSLLYVAAILNYQYWLEWGGWL